MLSNYLSFILFACAAIASTRSAIIPPNPHQLQQQIPVTRIRGGKDTVIEIHPHQVSIGLLGTHQCGGSIISNYHVITAGHCAVFPTEYMTVRAGTSFRDKKGSLHKVEKYVRHEDFFENDFGLPVNDLAIIRLQDPFVFDDTHQPIELSSEEVQPGRVAVVTGWGNTGEGYLADQLQSLAVTIIPKAACNLTLQEVNGLGKGQICTKYEGKDKKDACNGDSGGPLTLDGKLVGIISYGDDCRLLEYPGMYTEVAYFYHWIVQHRNF